MPNFTPFEYAQMLQRQKREAPASDTFEPVAKESTLHEQIIQECRSRGWQYLHGAMSERTHRTLGEPDFQILASDGRHYMIEAKRKGAKLSPAQQAFKHHAEKNGHKVHTVFSFQQFLEIVKD